MEIELLHILKKIIIMPPIPSNEGFILFLAPLYVRSSDRARPPARLSVRHTFVSALLSKSFKPCWDFQITHYNESMCSAYV